MNNDCGTDPVKFIKIYPLFSNDYYNNPKIWIGFNFKKGMWIKADNGYEGYTRKIF